MVLVDDGILACDKTKQIVESWTSFSSSSGKTFQVLKTNLFLPSKPWVFLVRNPGLLTPGTASWQWEVASVSTPVPATVPRVKIEMGALIYETCVEPGRFARLLPRSSASLRGWTLHHS